MNRLSARNLAKKYRHRTVVDDVSMDVQSGEIVGLLGPNGAGKTTCFYMIAGLIPTEGGSVSINGNDVSTLPMHARARLGLGYLAQEPSVFRKLNVADNILAMLETRSELPTHEQHSICDNLLLDFGLSHLRGNLAMSLSGGERRRLEIARALALEPDFILLDEPFAGIDPISVKDIQGIIQELRSRDIGILITDHNVRETLGICDKAYILYEGKVIIEGEPDSILADQQVRSVYLGSEFRM